MKLSRLIFPFMLLAGLSLLRANDRVLSDSHEEVGGDGSQAKASAKISDPSKPCTMKIYIQQGDLKISVCDSADTVTVQSDAQPEHSDAKRADGLRVLSTSAGFSLSEKANVVELNYGQGFPTDGHSGADFIVTVPKQTSLEITNGWGGDIQIRDVAGDVCVKSMNGEIKLEGLSGGALVDTMNGEITASLSAFSGKPLSFTSMNGEVTLHVPSNTKANVRFRTHNGSILTDFDENQLKTKSEPASSGREHAEVARQAAEAAREIVQEAARTAREVAADIRESIEEGTANSDGHSRPAAPRHPHIPRPPSIPAISGGKVVSGTLNGGGPDIQATTMNGDIVIRQLKGDSK